MNALNLVPILPKAAWDLKSFFDNAKDYGQLAGGSFLSLMGLVAVIWGGTLLLKKLMSQQSNESWLKIIGLIIIGGAIMATGITLITTIAAGGQTTIEDLGGGVVLLSSLLG